MVTQQLEQTFEKRRRSGRLFPPARSIYKKGKAAGEFLLKSGVFILGAGLAWEAVYLLMVEGLGVWQPALFPSPLEVLASVKEHLENGTLVRAAGTSFVRLVIGFGLSLPGGVLLGLGLSQNKLLRQAAGPVVLGFQALPSVCWLPLAILWFGLNETSIIFVVIMGSIFSITLATYDGTKIISPLLLKASQNMGLKGGKLFWRVILPACLPAIVAGSRQGWSFAWRSLLGGELLTAGVGLGNLLNQGRDLTDMPLVMAVMLVIILLGLAVDQLLLNRIERRIAQGYGLAGLE